MNTVMIEGKSVTPSKIVCIGRNYVQHIKELGNEVPDEMVVFNKPNSAISKQLFSYCNDEQLHYEGELCFLVEKGKFVAVAFGLDLTKRRLQTKLKAKGLPWERAKAFDNSAVFSDFVSIDNLSIDDLTFELVINDELVQIGSVVLMMYKPATILSELKKYTSLNDGDIVMTGTPKGVGPIPLNAIFKARVLKGNKELISAQWRSN